MKNSQKEQNNSQFLTLARDLLADGKPVRFQAHGLSMRPSICDGDYLQVVPAPLKSVRLGDIVFAVDDTNKIIVHRVIRLKKQGAAPYALLRGDACSGACEKIPAAHVLGRVGTIERDKRSLPLNTPRQKLKGLFYIAVAPFMIWIFPTLSRIKNRHLFSR